MPVVVSLRELVKVKGTRGLWPAAFADLVAALEDNPDEKTRWGVVADWCEGDEACEKDLAEAFRWVFKRPEVTVERGKYYPKEAWSFGDGGMPPAVRGEISYYREGTDLTSLAGLAAALADALQSLREQMF